MASQAEVADLIKIIRATKTHKVAKSGSKHYKVLTAKGAVVVDPDGPLIISSSPSDSRFREMTVKRLMRAGVLKTDPYKKTTSADGKNPHEKNGETNGNGNGRQSPFADPEQAERINLAKVRAIQARSDANKERTGRIRARFEPIAAKLGGWTVGRGNHTSGLSATEVGEVIYAWAKSRGRMELPRWVHADAAKPITADHVGQAVGRLKRSGETMSEKWTPLFEVFVDELERNAGVPVDYTRAAHRYRELLRESKGISDGPTSPAVGPPVSVSPVVVDPPEVDSRVEAVGPLYDAVGAPETALRAMWLMSRGATDEDRADVLDLGKQIAEMELATQRRRST